MKKLENVFKDWPGRGITSPIAAFPRIFFGRCSLILPGKLTTRGGAGTSMGLKNLTGSTLSRQGSTRFDNTYKDNRRNNGRST